MNYSQGQNFGFFTAILYFNCELLIVSCRKSSTADNVSAAESDSEDDETSDDAADADEQRTSEVDMTSLVTCSTDASRTSQSTGNIDSLFTGHPSLGLQTTNSISTDMFPFGHINRPIGSHSYPVIADCFQYRSYFNSDVISSTMTSPLTSHYNLAGVRVGHAPGDFACEVADGAELKLKSA